MTEKQKYLTVRVECYAGYRADESPRRFYIGNKLFEVEDIIDRWLAPEYRYFKVLANDNATYILRHDVKTDQWELTFFEKGVPEGPFFSSSSHHS